MADVNNYNSKAERNDFHEASYSNNDAWMRQIANEALDHIDLQEIQTEHMREVFKEIRKSAEGPIHSSALLARLQVIWDLANNALENK